MLCDPADAVAEAALLALSASTPGADARALALLPMLRAESSPAILRDLSDALARASGPTRVLGIQTVLSITGDDSALRELHPLLTDGDVDALSRAVLNSTTRRTLAGGLIRLGVPVTPALAAWIAEHGTASDVFNAMVQGAPLEACDGRLEGLELPPARLVALVRGRPDVLGFLAPVLIHTLETNDTATADILTCLEALTATPHTREAIAFEVALTHPDARVRLAAAERLALPHVSSASVERGLTCGIAQAQRRDDSALWAAIWRTLVAATTSGVEGLDGPTATAVELWLKARLPGGAAAPYALDLVNVAAAHITPALVEILGKALKTAQVDRLPLTTTLMVAARPGDRAAVERVLLDRAVAARRSRSWADLESEPVFEALAVAGAEDTVTFMFERLEEGIGRRLAPIAWRAIDSSLLRSPHPGALLTPWLDGSDVSLRISVAERLCTHGSGSDIGPLRAAGAGLFVLRAMADATAAAIQAIEARGVAPSGSLSTSTSGGELTVSPSTGGLTRKP